MKLRLLAAVLIVWLTSCGGGESSSPGSTGAGDDSDTGSAESSSVMFSNVTKASGIDFLAGFQSSKGITDVMKYCGGVAAGDVDGDGLTDLFFIKGDIDRPSLYQNLGNNQYRDITPSVNIEISNHKGCGPMFADVNGDGWLDLFIGGIGGDPSYLLIQQRDEVGDIRFVDKTEQFGLAELQLSNTVSASFGDYDGDGWLDMFLGHWGTDKSKRKQHLWRNIHGERFVNVTQEAGLAAYMVPPPSKDAVLGDGVDYSFSGAFSDVNNDNCPDLLVVGDFATSQVFINRCDGVFEKYATSVIDVANGMGAATGDLDNDGDLDWFVSGIALPSGQGNRLYRNNYVGGAATEQLFSNVTDESKVFDGGWGWAVCLADFDANGYLDVFHVNGWQAGLFGSSYANDRSRLFMAKPTTTSGDIGYDESARALGITDRTQGRGAVCFDADNDGDVDLAIANGLHDEGLDPVRLYRNNSNKGATHYTIRLQGVAPNHYGIGSKIWVESVNTTQMREVTANSNFVSNNPAEQYVALPQGDELLSISVHWRDGERSQVRVPEQGRVVTVVHPGTR